MDFEGAMRHIQHRLKTELAEDLYYHGYHHTLDVYLATEKIAAMENVSEEELTLLKTAAWFHDSGFLNVYKEHEKEGVSIAKEVLPKFGYSDKQIDCIEGMIMATKIPQSPQSHLEQIICDADLEYLGGDNYYTIAESLRKELFARKILQDPRQWIEMQIKFLQMHHYFTQSAKNMCDEDKSKRLLELKEQLQYLDHQ